MHTLDQLRAIPVSEWNTEHVASWLIIKGFPYADKFKRHHVDGEVLALLKEEDLKEDLKIPSLGHRLKLWKHIGLLFKPVRK